MRTKPILATLGILFLAACASTKGNIAGVTGNVHESSTDDFDVTIVQSNPYRR